MGSVEQINLREMVYNANLQLDQLIRERAVQFEFDLELEEATFNGFALQQVLVNLIGNAIKYASPERAPLVRIGSRRSAQADIIEVADNGVGMDDAQRARIFEKHSRFRPANVAADGHGIGMYTVKRLVESGGGRITVESSQGKGTTVTLLLRPAETVPASPGQSPAWEAAAHGGP
jgi:Amt family ammonium transporter